MELQVERDACWSWFRRVVVPVHISSPFGCDNDPARYLQSLGYFAVMETSNAPQYDDDAPFIEYDSNAPFFEDDRIELVKVFASPCSAVCPSPSRYTHVLTRKSYHGG